jgi:hypothetical protein
MNKIILLAIVVLLAITACEQSGKNKLDRYADAYYDILVIRETVQDTAIANPMVDSVINHYGFTGESYLEYSQELFREDPKNVMKLIDSLRSRVDREIIRQSEIEKGNDTIPEK